MGRKVDVDDLVDAREVAEMLGLGHRNAVSVYYLRYGDFPEPVVEKGRGRTKLWDKADIEAWRARGEHPPRDRDG